MSSINSRPKVLVVDDEPMVRRLVSTVLTHSGYPVVAADSADQAIAVLEHDPYVRLMLTDVAMPGADGCELARQMRKRRPSLKILFMSGYGTPPSGDGFCGDKLIAKPFRIDDLLRYVEISLA